MFNHMQSSPAINESHSPSRMSPLWQTRETGAGISLTSLLDMPPVIAAAIFEVMAAITGIERDVKEEQDGRAYSYASVDAMLSATQPLCAEAGITPLPFEVATAWLPSDGETAPLIQTAYQFVLLHKSGKLWTHERFRQTITAIYEGQKTAASMQSTALKAMMKALFQIATADAPPAEPQPTAKKTAKPDRAGTVSEACQRRLDIIAGCDSLEQLDIALEALAKADVEISKPEQALTSARLIERRRDLKRAAGIGAEDERTPVNGAAKAAKKPAKNTTQRAEGEDDGSQSAQDAQS